MKKNYIYIFILFIVALFLLVFSLSIPHYNILSSQETNDNKDLKTDKAKELVNINISGLLEEHDFDIIYKENKILVKAINTVNYISNLFIIDKNKTGIKRKISNVFNAEETNNPDQILLSKKVMTDEGKTLNSIFLANISSGNINQLIENVIPLYNRDFGTIEGHQNTSSENNNQKNSIYFEFLPKVNMFLYNTKKGYSLYNMSTQEPELLSYKEYDFNYLGKTDTSLNLIFLGKKNGKQDIIVYNIISEKLYKAGSGIIGNISRVYSKTSLYSYIIPLENYNAFLFMINDEDTNQDNIINHKDKIKLYISYLNTKSKNLIYEGDINSIDYYASCDYLSVNNSASDKLSKLYLYNILNKKRVLISKKGQLMDFIPSINSFIFYQYKEVNGNNDITTLLYSINDKKIKKLSSNKILKYYLLDGIIIYSLLEDSQKAIYTYNTENEETTLLARNLEIEAIIPEYKNIILSRDNSLSDNDNVELLLWELKNKTIVSLGKEYVNMNKYKKQNS
ncbi:MAG: hypothetical protein ACOCV8_03515, partial [Spirochaetota bacterium]